MKPMNNITEKSGGGLWQETWKRLKRDRAAMFGLVIIGILITVGVLAPLFAPYNPFKVTLEKRLLGPSLEHWLGTDHFGRDILSRIIYGARISLEVGIIASSISLLLGMLFGTVAGYYGGWIDNVIMRFTDIMFGFPALLFLIGIMAAFEPNLTTVFFAIGFVSWPRMARIMRGQVLSVKENDYVMANVALGQKDGPLILRHIIPNCLAPVIVAFTMGIASAIMAEASLSFLGLGAQPPTPSWGSMVNFGKDYLRSAPWLTMFPGIAIGLTVLGFNLFGDGLRDALDPTMELPTRAE
ncbi:MAG: Glutathione transport system permease protein GsiD [Candidatus Marinimicrobia bacterium]|nr:Glutathione transport system permease protein GsiD [Candidatus Neomarinimicrobiota bacterium]